MTPSREPAIWISESEVVSMMDMAEAVTALAQGLLAEAQGLAQNMVKTHLAKAMASGLGFRIPHPQKVSPRLRTRELANTLQGG